MSKDEDDEQIVLDDLCKKSQFSQHPKNPLSRSEVEWIFRNRKINGFEQAFIRVSSRSYLVNIPKFIKCLAGSNKIKK